MQPQPKRAIPAPDTPTVVSRDFTEDVQGAPFKIGQRVIVALLADETADAKFLSHAGRVVTLCYNTGCGDTYPHDPMIKVHFEETDLADELFWHEELEVA